MEGFSHLKTVERLFIARHRFKMLSSVLLEILELNEQKKAFVYAVSSGSSSFSAPFGAPLASWPANFISSSASSGS